MNTPLFLTLRLLIRNLNHNTHGCAEKVYVDINQLLLNPEMLLLAADQASTQIARIQKERAPGGRSGVVIHLVIGRTSQQLIYSVLDLASFLVVEPGIPALDVGP